MKIIQSEDKITDWVKMTLKYGINQDAILFLPYRCKYTSNPAKTFRTALTCSSVPKNVQFEEMYQAIFSFIFGLVLNTDNLCR